MDHLDEGLKNIAMVYVKGGVTCEVSMLNLEQTMPQLATTRVFKLLYPIAYTYAKREFEQELCTETDQ